MISVVGAAALRAKEKEPGEGEVEAAGLRGPGAWGRSARHTRGPRYVQAECRHRGPRETLPEGGTSSMPEKKAPSKTPRG